MLTTATPLDSQLCPPGEHWFLDLDTGQAYYLPIEEVMRNYKSPVEELDLEELDLSE